MHIAMESSLQIHPFFDETTNTYSYLIADGATKEAAIIDPVLNFNYRDGRITTTSADNILKTAAEKHLTIKWLLETHIHADHLSAAYYIKQLTHAKIGISEHVRQVQQLFNPLFNYTYQDTEHAFDCLFTDNQQIQLGSLTIAILQTPGHTPACAAYYVEGCVFVGDTIFMPDFGTARADFPGGDAKTLYQSIQRLLALPETTRVFLCHDYKAAGRDEYCGETTVIAEKQNNIHLRNSVTEAQFITMRQTRDATLAAPTLLLPAIQVNLRAGKLPEPESNERRYLKIPLTIDNSALNQ